MNAFIVRTCILAVLLSAVAPAQNPFGRIIGRVTDSSGAVIPKVAMRAVHTDTGMSTSSASNPEGNYELQNLPPGRYRIEAQLAGFKRYLRESLEVRVGDALDVPIVLEVGTLTENIEVKAETPILDSTTASIGQVVDNQRIVDLPLAGGNPMYLTQLAPGVVQTTSPGYEWLPQAVGPTSNAVVAGTRNGASEFLIDGVPNMADDGMIAFSPPPEMVQEFRVESAPFDASVGHFTGGSINLVLKGGTNRFRGNLFFSHLSRPLMTHPFFVNRSIYDTRTGPVTPEKINTAWPYVRLNRYRATFGGPVSIPRVYNGRNRTFWTFGFDWLDRLRPEPNFYTVPPPAQRSGDFSALLALGSRYQIYDPATIAPAAGARFSRLPFPGNVIAPARLDATAQKILSYYPLPNLVGTADGRNNYYDPRPRTVDYKSEITRIDHQFSPNHRVYGSLSLYQNFEHAGDAFHNAATGLSVERWHRGFALDDVVTVGAGLVINVRYGLTRKVVNRGPVAVDLAQLGFAPSLAQKLDSSLTTFPNITSDYTQTQNTLPERTRTNRHILSGTVSTLRGNHGLRFGGEYRVFQANDALLGHYSPLIDFGAGWTRGPLNNSPVAPIGQGSASLVLGLPTGGSIDRNDSMAAKGNYAGLFLQDEWKVAPRLSVSAGVRWEMEAPLTERYNRMNRGFDFSVVNPIQEAARANYADSGAPEVLVSQFQTLGGILFAGAGGVPRALRRTDWKNFAPRLGVAYRLHPKAVIRAGYAIFFDSINDSGTLVLQQGFNQTTSVVPSLDNGLSFRASLANPFPDGFAEPEGAANGLRTYLGRAIDFVSPDARPGYMQRWSFTIQRQFGHVLVEAGYMGNRGTGLGADQEFNAIPARNLSTAGERDQSVIDFLSPVTANPFSGLPEFKGTGMEGKTVARTQLLRPYPQFGNIGAVLSYGYSWYHGLLLRAERRMSRGFTIQSSYTWSKAMEAIDKLNPTDVRLHRVISSIDRPHRLVSSGILEMPFGRGRRWLARPGRLVDGVLGGWSVQSIHIFQSGPPINFGNIIFRGDIKNIALPSSQRTVERWFNTEAGFERRSEAQLVSNIRAFPLRFSGIRAGGFNNVDLSVFKTIRVSESLRLQIRAEAQNSMNHAIFQAPNANPSNSLFGQISNGEPEQRRITLGAKLMW